MDEPQAYIERRDFKRIFRIAEEQGLTISLRQADYEPAFVLKTGMGRFYTPQTPAALIKLMVYLHKQTCSRLWYQECLLTLVAWRDSFDIRPGYIYWSLDTNDGCILMKEWLSQSLEISETDLLIGIAELAEMPDSL